MKHILLFLLLFASGSALADSGTPDDLGKLEAALNEVLQEQQSVYQDYQMTKEMRLQEVQEGSQALLQQPYGLIVDTYGRPLNIRGMTSDTPPPNYDDVVRTQLAREQRIQQQTDELKKLSLRYLELEQQRKALRAQIRKLKQPSDE